MKKDNKLYVRKILLISKLSLIVALGYMVVRTVLLSERIENSLAPASARGGDKVHVSETIEPPVLSLEDYADIIEKNPFGTSDQTSIGKLASMSNLTSSGDSISKELGVALFGTVSGNPAVARAIVKDLKTGVFDLYRVDQTVAGARIESIGADAVILIHNGERKILGLNNASILDTRYSPPPLSQVRGSTLDENRESKGIENRTGEARTNIGHVETILKQASIESYIVDDRAEGLRITGLEKIPEAKNIGLMNGDVIRAVNGHLLTSKQKAYQIFKKARAQSIMNLELLRDNETKRFSFSLR